MTRYLCLTFGLLLQGEVPQDAVEAHRYADGVLALHFQAAFNDWAYQHPRDEPGREWEHCRKLNLADAKRWKEVRERFRSLDAAMKRAGY